uniref:Uncharacterized protein n=1 Tax=Romanomermis culicivorax TaxID=13658 RepID=A0A915HGV6_ROMCU
MAVNARYFDPKYKFEAKNLKTCRPHEPCKFQKKIMSTKYTPTMGMRAADENDNSHPTMLTHGAYV